MPTAPANRLGIECQHSTAITSGYSSDLHCRSV